MPSTATDSWYLILQWLLRFWLHKLLQGLWSLAWRFWLPILPHLPILSASNDSLYSGVAFNTNGARPLNKSVISVGLRWDIYGLSCIIPFLCMSYLNISITYLSYLGLSRLCTNGLRTNCCPNNYEQFLLYCAIFVQNMALGHISSTKKSTVFI